MIAQRDTALCPLLFGVDTPNLLWHREQLALLNEVLLPSATLILLAQAEAPVQTQDPAFSGGVLDLLVHTGPVAKFVLATLVVFSLISWGIILYKGIALRRAHASS